MTREKKPRTNHWMYQGYRADGNENTYTNLSLGSSKVTYKGQIWAEYEKKKKKEGPDDWFGREA